MEQLIDFHAPEVQAVLDTLLKDKSTGKNIIWATDPPEELQTVMYEPVTDRSQITTQQLRLTHYEVVLPRMMKQTDTQQQRTRKKGEVFSPAWVCNTSPFLRVRCCWVSVCFIIRGSTTS